MTGALPAPVMNQHLSVLDSCVVSAELLFLTDDVQLPVGERSFRAKTRRPFAVFQFGLRFFSAVLISISLSESTITKLVV